MELVIYLYVLLLPTYPCPNGWSKCGIISCFTCICCSVFKWHFLSSPIEMKSNLSQTVLEASWNVMSHAQKPDFVFQRDGRVHLNRRGRQFSRLLAAEVCASAVVMLGTPCCEVVWRVLATHSIRQFPLHFPSRVSYFNWSLHSCYSERASDGTTAVACHWFSPNGRFCKDHAGLRVLLLASATQVLRVSILFQLFLLIPLPTAAHYNTSK